MNEHIQHTEQHKIHPLLGDEPFVDPKVGSTALMMAPRFSPLMRRTGRAVVVYGLSYAAVKALDVAAENNPKNGFVVGADQIANVIFGWENLMVSGILMIAAAGYEAAARPKALPEPILAKQLEPPKSEPPLPKHHHHRNRAPLNAQLAPDLREPAPPLFGHADIDTTPAPKGKREIPVP